MNIEISKIEKYLKSSGIAVNYMFNKVKEKKSYP